MATPEDISANAEYIRLADQYVEVPGGTNNNNYANVELIVEVAERSGVDAVWAGWGHASENARLPDLLQAHSPPIVFIGPPGHAMRSLGDKISSTIVAQSAGVPTLPWSGDGITLEKIESDAESGISISTDIYNKACIFHADEGLEHARRIGFPVMIKASEGGGGKGIRAVFQEKDFTSAFEQCLREVPGSPIFMMKLADNARHLEVQVLSDRFGNSISLFGRDCSVQRRHQKIIEEAPITIAPQETTEKMEQAAIRLASMVGYESAGTVEYLYEPKNNRFYFLELNPRLQVEHPCSEIVSGVNLPVSQLLIACGVPLYRMNDIRALYGLSQHGQSPIDFQFTASTPNLTQRKPSPKGHVIAARITAENPDAGFKPSGGVMRELNFRSSTHVWGYFSVGVSGGLHEFADSQFGHVFAYGENREQARKNMIIALKELSIRGDFRTTVEYLVKLLEHETFAENRVSTEWLDNLISHNVTAERPDKYVAVIIGAVTKAYSAFEKNYMHYLNSLRGGRVVSRSNLRTDLKVEVFYDRVKYCFFVVRCEKQEFKLSINGSSVLVNCRILSDGGFLVLLNSHSYSTYVKEEPLGTLLTINGQTCVLEKENDPSQLRSPSPGKLVRYLINDGDNVKKGSAYAEIEVMKMVMQLRVTEDGKVNFSRQPGASLGSGDVIATLVLDDPESIRKPTIFDGKIPDMEMPIPVGDNPRQKFYHHLKNIENILNGFEPVQPYHNILTNFISSSLDEKLPFNDFKFVLSSLNSRLPSSMVESLKQVLENAKKFDAESLREILETYRSELVKLENDTSPSIVQPLVEIVDKYGVGKTRFVKKLINKIINSFYEVEILFDKVDDLQSRAIEQSTTTEGVIHGLRERYKENLEIVIEIARSHVKVLNKVQLMLEILKYIEDNSFIDGADQESQECKSLLRLLAGMNHSSVAPLALRSREILVKSHLPSFEERKNQLEEVLHTSVKTGNIYGAPVLDKLRTLVDSDFPIFDALMPFFEDSNPWICFAAMEVYIRKAYHAYTITGVEYHKNSSRTMIEWDFTLGKHHKLQRSITSPLLLPHNLKQSLSSESLYSDKSGVIEYRKGIMTFLDSLNDAEKQLTDILQVFGNFIQDDQHSRLPNCVNVVVQDTNISSNFNEEITKATTLLTSSLLNHGVRRITYIFPRNDEYPGFCTYRAKFRDQNWVYEEDLLIKNVEPAMAYQLELHRMANFDVRPVIYDENHHLHIYFAQGKNNSSDWRFFLRTLVRPQKLRDSNGSDLKEETTEYLTSLADRVLSEALDSLELATADKPNADCNHIFINFVPQFHNISAKDVMNALPGFIQRHGYRLWRLRVTGGEIRITVRPENSKSPAPLRFFLTNVSGYVLNIEGYEEIKDSSGKRWVLQSLDEDYGSFQDFPTDFNYDNKGVLQPKRHKAHLVGTTYCYDFPDLFQQALKLIWEKSTCATPPILLESEELVQSNDGKLLLSSRSIGMNKIGMVGWKMKLFTPEYPDGREIVVIANDITFKIGSFGYDEDVFFHKCTQYAIKNGIPRIYLSANSGARIGLAEELIEYFKVEWENPEKKSLGFKYFYLTEEDVEKIQNLLLEDKNFEDLGNFEKIIRNGSTRYVIKDIFGLRNDIGVENLQGSGMIAGDTAKAYREIFTITLISCRSVGIGAYLARLGQRVVQVAGHPIILTGCSALNKLLGRDVYTSNLQLGGIQVMNSNGVTHKVVADDFQGIMSILEWLSFVPKHNGAPNPVAKILDDPVDRKLFLPQTRNFDVRSLLCGFNEMDKCYAGLFDKGSFREVLSGWAKGVVTGRARLGGIPVGVIAVETRTTKVVIPADPAFDEIEEQVIQQPGQVWFPNSAFKTAQAISDFNHGEQLPLFILANWRGFSGGMMDMFNEILKFGSMIVDEISRYRQPIFVYIPPEGELRGGAWVVLDSKINPTFIEMYVDPTAKAGILEPNGIVEIKFRKPQLLKLMERLDPKYMLLKKSAENPGDSVNADEVQKLKSQLEDYERAQYHTFHRIATKYAELHDTPERMKSKKVIRDIVPWKHARSFFYYRLKRRLLELSLKKEIFESNKYTNREHDTDEMFKKILNKHCELVDLENDRKFLEWLESGGSELIKSEKYALTKNDISFMINSLLDRYPEQASEALMDILRNQFASFMN